jgi:hypothetical protein
MITEKDIREAEQWLIDEWGAEVGGKVVNEASFARHTDPFLGGCDDFLDHCYMCGGNWVAMYLSGLKKIYPRVYDALPEELGENGNAAFLNVAYVLMLCGVDTSK